MENLVYNSSSQSTNYNCPSPSVSKVYNPTIMQPVKADFTPPPPVGIGHRLSLRVSKQEAPNQATMHQQSMNLYNPLPAQEPSFNALPGLSSYSVTPAPVLSQPELPKKDSLESEYVKAQIPHEHLVLQETFDSIVVRCKNASSNPQTKRKIEDVHRKLEILYDLLRENKVSQSVLNGLHQMVQACHRNLEISH